MSSPWKKQPEDVADSILKRAEVSKIARRLQDRLALAQFKAKHGWENLTLDTIEPKMEEEMRLKKLYEGDVLSDSSSGSDLPYPKKTLMSSPLKAPIFSDAIGSSNGSSGHRKRTYIASFNDIPSSPSKRFRASPTLHKSFQSYSSWKDAHQLAQSSPIKPRRQPHFTTSSGPDVSFFRRRRTPNELGSPNFAGASDNDEDLLPAHSFSMNNLRSSPPRTPPMQNRALPNKRKAHGSPAPMGKSGEEGADLLLYLAASPSPAVTANRGRMERLTTPPPKTPKSSKLDLPSSMMTTPGGSNLFPSTPGTGFDLAEFVNITPSPAQKQWRTPAPANGTRTPMSIARRRLTFDDPMA
ncbi:cyclin-dependent kinase [Cordyceps fumosorosea ARSEF 2679]|uniref:Cyclin-dependent kinase n=1 Tax=Cordyceps fumosorosea (strain ARSEF 2679) TaxID=1081104 RepID=A0A168ECQ7_CORFA|nr:cyclin-dependent kinase [Cordyceps fumosorosea ARSEF 2679]OAA73655.1 cyclin-dependent kinase [Cordyceps fumosorosea ARSEF 2679]